MWLVLVVLAVGERHGVRVELRAASTTATIRLLLDDDEACFFFIMITDCCWTAKASANVIHSTTTNDESVRPFHMQAVSLRFQFVVIVSSRSGCAVF